MKAIAERIENTIGQAIPRIRAFSDTEFYRKPNPNKWSRSEVLGHLVDSAQNNLQRFVRAQYEDTPHIVYHQDDWVRLQHYRDYDREQLLTLWIALNRHLCRVLGIMDPAMYERTCNVGKNGPEVHSLRFIAEDYLAHLKHHLNQIESGPGD